MAKKSWLKKHGLILIVLSTLNIPFSSITSTETLTLQLLYQKIGTSPNQLTGIHVTNAGDVNGDGKADFFIGTTFSIAYVYSGATGDLIYQKTGATIAGLGDINEDGKSDFITALPGLNGGTAFIYSGADGSLLYQKDGVGSDDLFGWAVGGTGDINGDAKNDFIIGAWRADSSGYPGSGAAYVYSGASGDLLYLKRGFWPFDRFGFSVAGSGDVNGDGKRDFIVGTPFIRSDSFLDIGAAYVYSGINGALLFEKKGIHEEDHFGTSVDGIGDINGDGKNDFIVGAPFADSNGLVNVGIAFIYSGLNGALLYQKTGVDSFGNFGEIVAGAGDINGDGKPDFLVGAPAADPDGLIDAGSVFVYSGLDGTLLFQINGDSTGDNLGRSVASAGDINSDGMSDIIVGAPYTDSNGLTDAGSVYIYGLVPTDAPEEKGNRPGRFELSQNYPNPFNPTTTIRYFLPKRESVTLEVFNLLGERVRMLTDEAQTGGEHTAVWDGKDKSGKILPSGIYFYQLKGEGFSETRKMIFLK